ncbi:MAG: hypothetical protein Q7S88_03290 [Candidatus Daviesbacteria bacterium]|nr:hypothetical protein [Candidatus Daviesbacteria bacterium]
MIFSEARFSREPILEDSVLSTKRREQFFADHNPTPFGFGASANVYLSPLRLEQHEREKASLLLGRFPSPEVLLKVAKPGILNAQLLKRDFSMLVDPYIQPFAVACSIPLGTTMLIEKAEGFDITKPEDASRLTREDVNRIFYQQALVYERFHENGVSPADVGKNAFYRREFDPKDPRPFAYPPRIILFDLAFTRSISEGGIERAIDVVSDQVEFVKNLKELFSLVARKNLTDVQQVVQDIMVGSCSSFARIADTIDWVSFGKFSLEYANILGTRIPPYDSSQKFSDSDFFKAFGIINEGTRIEVPQLGKDSGSLEGIVSAEKLGVSSNVVRLVSYYVESIVARGLNTSDAVRNYVLSSKFPSVDREDCLVRTNDGRTVLDVYLEELELQGIVKGEGRTKRPNTITETTLDIMLQYVAKGISRKRDLFDRIFEDLASDTYGWRTKKGTNPWMIQIGQQSLVSLLLDYLEETGQVIR